MKLTLNSVHCKINGILSCSISELWVLAYPTSGKLSAQV